MVLNYNALSTTNTFVYDVENSRYKATLVADQAIKNSYVEMSSRYIDLKTGNIHSVINTEASPAFVLIIGY